jgi:hypothetical protein
MRGRGGSKIITLDVLYRTLPVENGFVHGKRFSQGLDSTGGVLLSISSVILRRISSIVKINGFETLSTLSTLHIIELQSILCLLKPLTHSVFFTRYLRYKKN